MKGLNHMSSSHIAWCSINMVTTATMPYISGIELSAMGMQASSAISIVITNSNGCISPIWLLPISRMHISSVINIIAVLMNISVICNKYE